MHYFVAGMNGSGKTTLLKAIRERTGYDVVQGTQRLLEDLGIAGDYAALRAMDQDKVLEVWSATASKLVQEYGKKPFFLDSHILNLTHGEIIPRHGPWIGEYDALLLIEADPDVIVRRITADAGRDRALFPENLSVGEKVAMIAHYRRATRECYELLLAQYALPGTVITNQEDCLALAVDQFIEFDTMRRALLQ